MLGRTSAGFQKRQQSQHSERQRVRRDSEVSGWILDWSQEQAGRILRRGSLAAGKLLSDYQHILFSARKRKQIPSSFVLVESLP